MFALTSFAVAAALLVPAVLAPVSSQDCQPAQRSHRVSDDRAVARFVEAAHDFHGRYLLLVDRHTRQVIDILDDALGH